nr:MAG: hypothetical protein E4H34_02750 [Hyphomicrobiales bacterium]
MGRMQYLGWVIAASIFLSAQAPAGPSEEELCASILQERTEFMEECIATEREAHYFVMQWFDYNGLLTPEGEIDSLQLLEAQMDHMRAMYETPASTASFCIETTRDWIGLSECIALVDQDSLYNEAQPGIVGPGLGSEFGPGFFPEDGVN